MGELETRTAAKRAVGALCADAKRCPPYSKRDAACRDVPHGPAFFFFLVRNVFVQNIRKDVYPLLTVVSPEVRNAEE